MNKVTTKLNNNVRKALAETSISAEKHAGFDHFSYDVDWSNFPNSLLITCHIKSNSLSLPDAESTRQALSKLVQLKLLKQGIKFRDFRNNFEVKAETQIIVSPLSNL